MTWALWNHVPAGRGEPPRLEQLRLHWRMVGPSGKVLECALYRIGGLLELRCGYGANDPLRTRLVPDDATADQVAGEWKTIVLAKGSFLDLDAPAS